MSNLSWLPFAQERLQNLYSTRYRKVAAQAIPGGDINTTFRLTCDELTLFVKYNSLGNAGDMFQQEAFGLEQLARCSALKVPKVITQGSGGGGHFLLLEYLTLGGKQTWLDLGRGLAQCHLIAARSYGWPQTNFIGSTPQRNLAINDWQEFWWQNRLQPQLELCIDQGHSVFRRYSHQLRQYNTFVLADHQPEASLLHGDLWSGNVGFDASGLPCIYDPACYYGDRETDLALTELFGGYPPEFYRGYNAEWPLAEGYKTRKHWYNLYHLLNHANLFGGHYVDSCVRFIESL